MPSRDLRRRLENLAGSLLTGRWAFLLSGLVDVALALRLALAARWRSTISARWSRGQGSHGG